MKTKESQVVYIIVRYPATGAQIPAVTGGPVYCKRNEAESAVASFRADNLLNHNRYEIEERKLIP